MNSLQSALPWVALVLFAVVSFLIHRSNGTLAKGIKASLDQLLPSLKTHAEQLLSASEKVAAAQFDRLRAEAAKALAPSPAATVTSIAAPPSAAPGAAIAPAPSTVSGGTAVGATLSADGKSLVITTQAPYVPNPESNTPDWRKFTDTSPAGYAMDYQLNADGTVALDASGHPVAQVKFDGRLFPSDAAVALYRQGQASKTA